MMACVVKREPFFVYIPVMYFFKYTYKQNCCANYFHKQSAQQKKSIVGEAWWAI